MIDGITYMAGKAFKHFLSASSAICFADSKKIGDYTMRNVNRNGLSNVKIEWIPAPGSIPKQAYPEIGDVSFGMFRRWSAGEHSLHNRWQLHHHANWLYEGTLDATSRYVLIQSSAFVMFTYPEGNEAMRRKAEHDALAFANANTLITRHIGKFYFLVSHAIVYFSAPLCAAGWATGNAAAGLFDLIERSQERRLDAILSSLPESHIQDYTDVLDLVLNINEMEAA